MVLAAVIFLLRKKLFPPKKPQGIQPIQPQGRMPPRAMPPQRMPVRQTPQRKPIKPIKELKPVEKPKPGPAHEAVPAKVKEKEAGRLAAVGQAPIFTQKQRKELAATSLLGSKTNVQRSKQALRLGKAQATTAQLQAVSAGAQTAKTVGGMGLVALLLLGGVAAFGVLFEAMQWWMWVGLIILMLIIIRRMR